MKVKNISRILGVVLILCLLLSTMTAYATDINCIEGNGFQIKVLDDDRLQINENGLISYIEINAINTEITEVKLIEPGNDITVLTVNKSNSTVTSSKTGETISVFEDIIDADEQTEIRYVGEVRYKYISFAQIKSALGGTATIAGVASIIVAILVGAGYAIPGMLPTILTYLGGITGLISYVMEGSPNHGLKITLKCYLKTLHHGNETSQQEVWRVTYISIY